MSALIEFRQVCKTYQMGDTTVRAAAHISMRIERGGICGYRWPVRLRKIHLHEHHRLPGCAHLRHLSAGRTGRRADGYQSVGSDPQRAAGVHLSAVQPAAQAGPAGKCGGTADVCRRPQGGAPAAGPRGTGAGRPGRQAPPPAQSALRRSAAAGVHRRPPSRALAVPPSSWPTSPPAPWTLTPAGRCWGCSRTCTVRATRWYFITHDNSIAVQAQRIIRLEDGHVVYDGDARAPGGRGDPPA